MCQLGMASDKCSCFLTFSKPPKLLRRNLCEYYESAIWRKPTTPACPPLADFWSCLFVTLLNISSDTDCSTNLEDNLLQIRLIFRPSTVTHQNKSATLFKCDLAPHLLLIAPRASPHTDGRVTMPQTPPPLSRAAVTHLFRRLTNTSSDPE